MAYMRGDYYVWDDTENVFHIWSKDGYDGWDDTMWATGEESDNRRAGFEEASGVSIPTTVLDQIAMMRLAHILEEGRAGTLIDDAASIGNFGGVALQRNATVIKAVLRFLECLLWLKRKIGK